MLKIAKAVWQQILTDEKLHAAAGPFSGQFDLLKILLYTNVITPDRNSLLADFTEPTYTGYARASFAWGPIWQRPDGGFVISGVNQIFQMGDAALQTTVTGYGLATSGGTPFLVAAENFPAPITLTTILDAIQVLPQIVLGGDDNGSAIIQGP